MDRYKKLANEFLEEMECKGFLPPHPSDVGASMRGEMAVLRLLDQKKRRLTAGEISKFLNMTTPRIAAVLNSLERKGVIERGGDESDRRRVLVTLTERGNACCREKKDAMLTRLAMVFEAIGPEDAEAFIRLMLKVAEAAVRLHQAHGDIREPLSNMKTQSLHEGGKAIRTNR
ncbi:MAG: winged helix DNA-binding protein [Clostridia bacterium]|nr:winged helix DNA-binding protein [Clostridia bacterium]